MKKSAREVLDELVNDCNYLHDKNEDIGIEARIDQALLALQELLPQNKTKEEMLNCLTKPNDTTETMTKKLMKINEIQGYNQAIKDIKGVFNDQK